VTRPTTEGMRVLVACEYSARVRDAFRARGHDAWSCDLEPTEGDPTWHLQGDVTRWIAPGEWDLMIAFPPCTYLTSSNAKRWDAIAEQRAEALAFVRTLMDAPIPKIAVENPMGAIGSHIRPADQYVHPWMWGEPWQKRTGLWLCGLSRLVPSVTEKPPGVVPWVSAGYGPRRACGTRTPGGAVRASSDRSRTFASIANAMADQWG